TCRTLCQLGEALWPPRRMARRAPAAALAHPRRLRPGRQPSRHSSDKRLQRRHARGCRLLRGQPEEGLARSMATPAELIEAEPSRGQLNVWPPCRSTRRAALPLASRSKLRVRSSAGDTRESLPAGLTGTASCPVAWTRIWGPSRKTRRLSPGKSPYTPTRP